MMIRTDLRSLVALSHVLLLRSQRLIAESKKILSDSQKIVDDETAKRFERAGRLKRNAPKADSIPPL
jgi:hypothetical protein